MNNNIPEKLKLLAESAEIFDASEKIGAEFSLHIDQIGELDAQIRLTLRGFANSKNFTDDIQSKLEISNDLAKKITDRVNTDIFKVIKLNLQNQTPSESSLSSLESAGNFTIEPEQGGSDHGMQNIETKSVVIEGIENPTKINEVTGVNETHTEPLIDRLLAGPVVNVVAKSVQPPKMDIPKPPKPSADLYREPIQ